MRDHLRRARFRAWIAVYVAADAVERALHRVERPIWRAIRRAQEVAMRGAGQHIDYSREDEAELFERHGGCPF